jgi:4'-phosphopantetheinyl transferase
VAALSAASWARRSPVEAAAELTADAVHVWWLDAAPHDRAPRALLASYAGVGPDALDWRVGAHGKPELAHGDLAFNLSHSGGSTLLAVARGTAVGVDLEHRRRVRRRQALLARCFSRAERERIERDPDPDAILLALWSAKEAVVKAIGRGIAYGLTRVELGLEADGVRLVRVDGPAGPAERWRLHTLALERDALGALAYAGGGRRVEAFRAESVLAGSARGY